MRDLSHDALVK